MTTSAQSAHEQPGRGRGTWWWVGAAALVVVGVVIAAVWLVACSDGDGDTVAGTPASPSPTATAPAAPTPQPQPAPQPTPQPTPQPQPETAPQPEPEPAPQPQPAPGTDASAGLPGAGTGPFTGTPATVGQGGSWIADVRSAAHETYDRVVFEFDGSYVPQYQVSYTPTAGPFRDVPGTIVPVQGTAFLDVWLVGTSRNDTMRDYAPVYTGPSRVRSDTTAVTEAVELEDFEANVHWIIGLDEQRPFLVTTLESPSRLVIDVAT